MLLEIVNSIPKLHNRNATTFDSLHKKTSKELRSDEKFPRDYSLFKFGSIEKIREYADKIADKILLSLPEEANKVSLVTCGFKYIGSPNYYLAEEVAKHLKQKNSQLAVKLIPIDRSATHDTGYAASDKDSRMKINREAGFTVRDEDKKYISGSHLFFVDDARNTGSTELVITELVNEFNPANIESFYIVNIIAEDEDFSVEDTLNCRALEKNQEQKIDQDYLLSFLENSFKDDSQPYDFWDEDRAKYIVTKRLLKIFVGDKYMSPETFEKFFESTIIPNIIKYQLINCIFGEGYFSKLSEAKKKILYNLRKIG